MMYRYILMMIMLLPVMAIAQDKEAAKGKKTKCSVVDAVTKKPVKDVSALVQGADEKIAAPNGVFQAMLAPGMQVEITAPGYEDLQIMITPDGKCRAELTAEEDEEEGDDKEE